ncbi:YitT family protein [Metabacillus litoralis]|uniref:YitT family protein n=1 Tax=Metabacillus TaxID=2675233 RepID=UPI001B8F7C19|nr:YitT family protein [Metabacillus litoralis]MCM3161544.1 YitT family protein [Metabacillus litoralis]UHA59030.1 YitT family protein [Metabacillus litoralis]
MNTIKIVSVIVLGSLLLSIGINVFLTPYKVLDGGMIGIGLILHYLFDLKAGIMIIVFSAPIFLVAWIYYRKYFYNSLHGLLLSSFFIDLLKPLDGIVHASPIVSSIIGGIFVGSGIGLMLRIGTSTGGTDLLAQFISDRSGINVGILIFCIDMVVILLGGLLISSETLILSCITIVFVGLTTTIVSSKSIREV